jgi:hypothetical protein
MALSEDGIAAINHELNGTKWPSDARQSVIDLFERIAELEAEVGRLRMALEAAKPKRPNYGPTKAWVYEGPPLDIWMADKEATNDDATD